MQVFDVGKGTPYPKSVVIRRAVEAFKRMGIEALPMLTPDRWGVEIHDTKGYHPRTLAREVLYLFQGCPRGFTVTAPKSAEQFPLD